MITWGFGAKQMADARELVGLAQACEQFGFTHFWYGNEKLHPDMFIGLALVAAQTESLRVGTYVADPFWVHPAVTTAAVATLDHLAPGRVTLLVGAGGSGLQELGLVRNHPARAVEDMIVVAQRLLRGETFSYESSAFRLIESGLHFPVLSPIPVWVASRGAQVLEAAGRVADGVIIGTFARAVEISAMRDHVHRGLLAAGRRPEDVPVAVRVDVSLAGRSSVAREPVRSFIAGVLSASYPDRGFVRLAGLEIPEPLEEVCRTKDLRLAWRSGHLVADELVDAFAWAGTPEEVAARIRAVLDLGITQINVMFHPPEGETVLDQMRLFAETVMADIVAGPVDTRPLHA